MFVGNHKSYEHNGDIGKIIHSWWAYKRHILTTWKHSNQDSVCFWLPWRWRQHILLKHC